MQLPEPGSPAALQNSHVSAEQRRDAAAESVRVEDRRLLYSGSPDCNLAVGRVDSLCLQWLEAGYNRPHSYQ